MINPFQNLGLAPWIQKLCLKLGYNNPTKIQTMAIPNILKNENVIVNSETGSGKTAVFGLPILQQLSKDPFGIFALIITPSRELAMQIYEQLLAFGSQINLRCSLVIGGQDLIKQIDSLENIPHIIVGTPGRLVDILGQTKILNEYIENLQFIVLDEADRLFDSSIIPDITEIMKYVPQKIQIILATATLNDQLTNKNTSKILGRQLQFKKFIANQQKQIVETLKQQYVFMPKLIKDYYLFHIISQFSGVYSIIFVNQCKTCHIINLMLIQLGYKSVCLHSKIKQGKRIANLKKFRNQQANILVATDVASRGLDIPLVELILNYDIPRKSEDYIHRVGRTARKGKRGLSISLITQFDIQLIHNIESKINEKLELYKVNEEEVLENIQQQQKEENLEQQEVI